MFVSTLFVCNGNHINYHFEIFGCSLDFVSSKSNFGFNIQHNLNNSLPWDVKPSIILLLTILKKLNWVCFIEGLQCNFALCCSIFVFLCRSKIIKLILDVHCLEKRDILFAEWFVFGTFFISVSLYSSLEIPVKTRCQL